MDFVPILHYNRLAPMLQPCYVNVMEPRIIFSGQIMYLVI